MSEQSTSGTERTRVGHCKADETDVYAGRGPDGSSILDTSPRNRGWLGNPFTVADHGREECISLFRESFEQKIENDPVFRRAVRDLAGQTLGCWCQRLEDDKPACHAEIIAEYADRINQSRDTGTDRTEGSK